ncbi:MAG: choice-of-anchor U domain-containing protein [Dehalococcoidia bacterium]|jgi:hypothetical protein
MKEIVKRLSLILLAALLLPAVSTLALPGTAGANNCLNTVYVNGSTGDDAWDGSSPLHTAGNVGPKLTIQAGIDTACAAGTVNIAAGTYNQADFITINKSLTLLGAGAASTVINGSADPEDEVIGIYALNGGNVLIYGLTIRNGNWNGIYVDETALNNTITINDCVITHNDSIDYGGGIWIDNDNIVTLNRCTVSNNTATWVDDFAPEGRRAPADLLERGVFDDESGGLGGGIAAFGCTLNLNQCTISNNTAAGDLGIGGGIFAVYDTTLNMTGCTVSGNLAGRWGGGIFYGLTEIGEAAATVNTCNISNNLAGGGGGGLFILGSGFVEEYLSNPDALSAGAVPGDGYAYENLDGFYALDQQIDGDGFPQPPAAPVVLNNCTVANNAALNWGGGMSSAFSLYSLNGCTFSGNRTGLLGGGIGMLISLGNLVNCTVSGNSLTYPDPPPGLTLPETGFNPGEDGVSGDAQLPPVSNAGGGIASILGLTVFQSDTIANNSTGSDVNSYGGGLFNSRLSLAIFVNTIVANNTAVQQGARNCLNRGTVQSVGHNIDSLNELGFDAAGDQVNANPLLGPLQNNGGPTFTCAVGIDSPAFNRGDNGNAPATDQRGVARPQAVNCTIGAYEVGLNKSVTIPVSTGQGNATFTTDVGGITGLRALGLMDCATGSNLTFPFGYFSFEIVGLAPGATATITITLPANLPGGARYYKCLNGIFVDCSSLMSYFPGTNTLVLRIKDGGLGDGDGQVNGTIVDPGGPAVRTTALATSHSSTIPPPASTPVTLPNLVVQSASLSATSVKPGDIVTVNAVVANRGGAGGTSTIKLLVNGGEETSRHVTIESGKTALLTFTVTRSQPGSYSVSAGGVPAGSFTVADLAQPDLLLIISATFILVALIGGFIYMRGRQRHI